MFVNRTLELLEVQLKMETLKEYNEIENPAEVSQIECTWEEVKE